MAEGPVCWDTWRQPTVALSSTEAEYIALSDCSKQAIWLRSFESELGFSTGMPLPLCVDNQGAIFLAVNPAHDRRTKHIDLRYHRICHEIERGSITLYHVPTEEQYADLLTKNLGYLRIEKLSRYIHLTHA